MHASVGRRPKTSVHVLNAEAKEWVRPGFGTQRQHHATNHHDHVSPWPALCSRRQISNHSIMPSTHSSHDHHRLPPCSNTTSSTQAQPDAQPLSLTPAQHTTTTSTTTSTSRRTLLGGMTATISTACLTPYGALIAAPLPASASKLPVFADQIWEAMGGGPSDLTFPESFLGVWDVESVLIQVELPLGEEVVPDMTVVRRAKSDDLNRSVKYQVAFMQSPRDGRVIFDRAFNTASLLSYYYGKPASDLIDRVQWNPADPNVLELRMPGGLYIRTRVTRRSEDEPEPDRIETSEFLEQVFDTSEQSESGSVGPRVKASQCFTKFKFRDEKKTPQGQPAIVATQIVSDYITPMSGVSDSVLIATQGRPITMYTYRMKFTRSSTSSTGMAATSS